MMYIPWIYPLSSSTNLYFNKNKEDVAGKNSDTLDGIAQSLLAVPFNYPTKNKIGYL
jgi:outer membrane protein OmpA-like peptidoglycan-associated protein